jgi:tRNA wybutosine-synthesizing protein 1
MFYKDFGIALTMVDEKYRELLESQGYRFLGEHSALKICGWTKKSISNQGVCYKEKFYGIRSHLCAQISATVNYCDFNCLLCWRKKNNSVAETIDDPDKLLDAIPEAQRKLLSGMGGHPNIDEKLWKDSYLPKHIAISLTGETLYYPKLNSLISKAHAKGYTTFVVTNGSQPAILEKLEMPTQLYLSIDAPNEEIFLKVDRPLNDNVWSKVMESVEVLKKLKDKTRTALRITLVGEYNMIEPENYAKIISLGDPHFVEVKGFMLVGDARNKLRLENMPWHDQVKEFALEICKHCDYKLIDEHEASNVVLLMKEDFDGRVMDFTNQSCQ